MEDMGLDYYSDYQCEVNCAYNKRVIGNLMTHLDSVILMLGELEVDHDAATEYLEAALNELIVLKSSKMGCNHHHD